MKLSYFSKTVPILCRKKSCVVLRLVQYSCLGHPGFITFSHFMSLHANYPRTLFLSLIMSSSKTDSRMNKNFFLRSQIWIWPMITIVVLSTNSWHKLINFGMVKPFFFFKFQFLIQQTKSFKGKKPDFFFKYFNSCWVNIARAAIGWEEMFKLNLFPCIFWRSSVIEECGQDVKQ